MHTQPVVVDVSLVVDVIKFCGIVDVSLVLDAIKFCVVVDVSLVVDAIKFCVVCSTVVDAVAGSVEPESKMIIRLYHRAGN